MKISLCIPQYNRIAFLLKGLSIIEKQQYEHIEIVISDDCSTDNTESEIRSLIPTYKYPIIYHRNLTNQGYDRNFRKSIELATGEYVIVLGNDDTLNPDFDITDLINFLIHHNYPEIGFSNFLEESSGNTFVERAKKTAVLGTGHVVAMKYYSCFSCVGGLIYQKKAFERYNSDKHDGSIYAQIYLACLMIASGCRLFSLHEPYIIKDVVLSDVKRNSYKDVLVRKWKDYKVLDGGLPSVINVLLDAFKEANILNQSLSYSIFKRIYTITYPFWIIDYKGNQALPAAVGLIQGLNPSRNINFDKLNYFNKARIWGYYILCSIAGLLMPVGFFNRIKNWLYKKIKG